MWGKLTWKFKLYGKKKQKMTHRRMQNSVHGAENSRKTAEDCNYVNAMVIMI